MACGAFFVAMKCIASLLCGRGRDSIIAALARSPSKMSTYLGNASLSTAVKERVQSTFQQTLALFKQGRTEEVLQGCGLILRMDPMFEQAVASGNAASARGDLDKIRSLDPDHPALARLEQAIGQGSAPAQSFVVDSPSQPSSRGSTQASDFGFTFEEEKQQQSPSATSP